MIDVAPHDFHRLLPHARFTEVHTRTIDQPIDRVWATFLALPADEIRLLRPLFELRGLPRRLTGKTPPRPVGDRPVLELFAEEGFVILHEEKAPTDGRALLTFGAAGQFWRAAHNTPRVFADAEEFIAFDEPGFAKTVARFEAWEEGGRTVLQTETRVVGTDRASTLKFAPYWTLIRLPSGLLRRSWLAAVDRAVTASAQLS